MDRYSLFALTILRQDDISPDILDINTVKHILRKYIIFLISYGVMVKLWNMDYDLWLDYVRNYEFLQKKLKLLFDTNIDILKQKNIFNHSADLSAKDYGLQMITVNKNAWRKIFLWPTISKISGETFIYTYDGHLSEMFWQHHCPVVKLVHA